MIGKRIKEIAKLIQNDESVIDVGCDHGYLAVQLKENGHQSFIICSDNKKGPLDNAKGNLAGLKSITFLLNDGIDGLDKPVDVCVMAGMGNLTIEHILENKEKIKLVKRLILQCNNNVDELRRYLMNNGWKITDESVVFDLKYYQILCVEKGDMNLNELQIKYGPYLLKQRSENFLNMLKEKKTKLDRIMDNISEEHEDYRGLSLQEKEIEKIIQGNY